MSEPTASPPSLPYDVFLSYRHVDPDRAFTLDLLGRLEAAGLRVAIDERDFRPEATFLEEMERCIRESRYMLAVLSPRYLESGNTMEEAIIRKVLDMDERRRRLIPLIAEEVARPVWMYDIVGIDFTAPDPLVDPFERLLRALGGGARGPGARRARTGPGEEAALPPAPPAPGRVRARAAGPAPGHVSTHRLPVTGEVFVGREGELAQLDRAWEEPGVHVISLVAWGGVGKSALVNRWLGGMECDGFRGAERVFAWSFYSQGSAERAESADAFFNEALRWFGDPEPAPGRATQTAVQRSERLVSLLRRERTLLVLDGLEPLQHPPGPLEGRLKDPALAVLVKELASVNPGLCVITTREKVAELASRAGTTAPRIDLDHLPPEAGAGLLKKLGVKGLERELKEAAREFGGHALALTLLGTCLRDIFAGDVRRRHEVQELEQDAEQGGHAQRVMASYEEWFGPGPEVAVLRLLGLFDRPADPEALEALRAAPLIPGLTDALFARRKEPGRTRKAETAGGEPLADADLARALARLRRAGLLAEPSPGDGGALDTHRLVRTYFGDRLQAAHPQAWREGNRRLYEHLRAGAPDLPNTFEQMLPLYAAVLHGCRAGRHQEAAEVYRRRIQRGDENYSTAMLGALGAALAALSGFFDRPWERLAGGITPAAQGYVLNHAGFHLRALGRLAEAVAPMQAALDLRVRQEDWANAALEASNLSDLTLTLGDLAQAVAHAERSIELADRSGDEFLKMYCRTTLADAAHQAGQIARAEALFQKAESLQERRQPEYPRLYSAQGYRYCDLLLGRIESALASPSPDLPLDEAERLGTACRVVMQRAQQTLGWAMASNASLLSVALDHLALGWAHLAAHQIQSLSASLNTSEPASLDLAAHHLDQAMDGLRRAGHEDYLPHGLLARATLRRVQRDATSATADLTEVFEIAERGSMRLHLCDAHLESALLALATGDPAATRRHLAEARALVEATGYHRRDPEVAALASALDAAG